MTSQNMIFHEIDSACLWHAVMRQSRKVMPNLDCQKPATDWLMEFHQGADRARYDVCDHERDPCTPLYVRSIPGHTKRIHCFHVFCTCPSVSLQRFTTWVICRRIHTLTRTFPLFELADTSQRTPQTSAVLRFKVGLKSQSIKSSDAELLYLSATATTSTTTN